MLPYITFLKRSRNEIWFVVIVLLVRSLFYILYKMVYKSVCMCYLKLTLKIDYFKVFDFITLELAGKWKFLERDCLDSTLFLFVIIYEKYDYQGRKEGFYRKR